MARHDKNIAKCLTEAQLVTLLHDEMPESERFGFEEHLLDCSTCVDEFATLSEAHLSVYEWNRDVFAFMDTPSIEIPYRTTAGQSTWLDRLYAAFATITNYGVPIASVAAIAIILVSGYLLLSYQGTPSLVDEPVISEAVVSKIPVSGGVSDAKVQGSGVAGNTAKFKEISINESKPRSFRPTIRVQKAVLKNQKRAFKPDALVAEQSSPRLTNATDLSDTSLRLMDLLSELDINE